MNSTALQLLALNASYSVMNATYGTADPTGAADSTAAFNAALATGLVVIPPGTYKITGNLTATPPVRIIGAGLSLVTINFYGSGDCLRINTTGTESGFARANLTGFTIDGTHASAGASGLHMGDTFAPHIGDVAVNNFQGSGSKNVWFDNQYNFMEQLTGEIFVRAGTSHVVFDNSANPDNSFGLVSFDRAVFDIYIDSDGVGDGVVFQNGALMFDGRLGIYGNFAEGTSQYSVLKLATSPSYSFTATHASPCVFTASGSYYGDGTLVSLSGGSLPAGFTATNYFVVNASGDTFQLSATSGGSAINSTSTGSGNVILYEQSGIFESVLNAGVELDSGGPGSTAPYTINFGTGFINQITGCTGIMDFGAGETFANAVNAQNSFQFDGPVFGDSLLFRSAGELSRTTAATSCLPAARSRRSLTWSGWRPRLAR